MAIVVISQCDTDITTSPYYVSSCPTSSSLSFGFSTCHWPAAARWEGQLLKDTTFITNFRLSCTLPLTSEKSECVTLGTPLHLMSGFRKHCVTGPMLSEDKLPNNQSHAEGQRWGCNMSWT